MKSLPMRGVPTEIFIVSKSREVKQFSPWHFRIDGRLDIFWPYNRNKPKKWMDPETHRVGIITDFGKGFEGFVEDWLHENLKRKIREQS